MWEQRNARPSNAPQAARPSYFGINYISMWNSTFPKSCVTCGWETWKIRHRSTRRHGQETANNSGTKRLLTAFCTLRKDLYFLTGVNGAHDCVTKQTHAEERPAEASCANFVRVECLCIPRAGGAATLFTAAMTTSAPSQLVYQKKKQEKRKHTFTSLRRFQQEVSPRESVQLGGWRGRLFAPTAVRRRALTSSYRAGHLWPLLPIRQSSLLPCLCAAQPYTRSPTR